MVDQEHPHSSKPTVTDALTGELYLAGERVPAGIYRHLGSGREICLEQEDTLPASLDGRVACYERIGLRWKHIQDSWRTVN